MKTNLNQIIACFQPMINTLGNFKVVKTNIDK